MQRVPPSPRLLLAAALGLAACRPARPAGPLPHSCAGGEAMVREEVYFGRGIPGGGEVSDSAWAAFLREEVTPRFPEGITVLEAQGQWKGRDGTIVRERTWVLVLYHPPSEERAAAVAALARAYATRFGQEAVLRDRAPACVAF